MSGSWPWVALQAAALIAGYEVVRFVVVRRARGYVHRQAVRFVREHNIPLESARFIDRVWIREALAQDPVIDRAVLEAAQRTGEPAKLVRDRVDAYVMEIAPYFSLSAYYRLGASVGRRLIDFVLEVLVEPGSFERQLAAAPEGAVRVYVINHRANMDPLILAYALLRHVPMSYAVGEWALVWPLHHLFRAFGSYFVRRGETDPLYHTVLERFVQTIASRGAVTGFFIEGGLSRDGALRPPRTGLLSYLVRLRRDQPDREIVFMPVGLNYDRVFEDRILTRDGQAAGTPRPTRAELILNMLAVVFWTPQLVMANLWKVATRSHRKFGYAAVRFGTPLRLSEWPGGSALHQLEGDVAEVAFAELAEELLTRRVGQVIPATPVPVLCAALCREGNSDAEALVGRVQVVLAELRAAGAPLALGAADGDARRVYDLASTLLRRRRAVRAVLTPTGDGVEVVEGAQDVIAYYANSIIHHLRPREG